MENSVERIINKNEFNGLSSQSDKINYLRNADGKLLDYHNELVKAREKFKNLFFELINYCLSKKRISWNEELTVREGSIYRWDSSKEVSLFRIMDWDFLNYILDNVSENVYERLQWLFSVVYGNLVDIRDSSMIANGESDARCLIDDEKYIVKKSNCDKGEFLLNTFPNGESKRAIILHSGSVYSKFLLNSPHGGERWGGRKELDVSNVFVNDLFCVVRESLIITINKLDYIENLIDGMVQSFDIVFVTNKV